jgi:trimeric autotransporter adhesin
MKLSFRIVRYVFLSNFIVGLSWNPCQADIIGLTSASQLVRFAASSPGITSSPVTVTGLNAGDALTSIDFRPSNSLLYGFAQNGAVGSLYTINPNTGAATLVTSTLSAITGSAIGLDFNPVPDRLRIVNEADQNLRANVDLGTNLTDLALQYAASDSNFGANPHVVAAAYTNSRPGVITATQLFVIDTTLDILALQNPPNNGTLNTIGSLGVDAGPNAAFDIDGATNIGYAVLSGNTLSQIDLSTGSATSLGNIGIGGSFIGLAAEISPIPEPTSLGLVASAILIGCARIRRKRMVA